MISSTMLTMSVTILSNSRKSSKISWVDGYNNLFGNEEKNLFRMPTLSQSSHQEQLNLFSEGTSEVPFSYQEIQHTKQRTQEVSDTPNNENGFNSNKAISSRNQFHKGYPSGVICSAFSVNKTKNTS